MLDPAILKDNLEELESNIARRNLKIDVNLLISLNDERKSLRFDAEQKRSQQKEIGKKIVNANENEKEWCIDTFWRLYGEIPVNWEDGDTDLTFSFHDSISLYEKKSNNEIEPALLGWNF